MKQKRKHILKKLLIFGIAVLLTSCSEELYEDNDGNSNRKVNLYEKKIEELLKDDKFVKSMKSLKSKTENMNSRTIMEDFYGFTIDSSATIKEIVSGGTTTYTMKVVKDSLEANTLNNLIVKVDSLNTTKAWIFTYNLLGQIVPTAHNSFSINFSSVDIKDINYNTNTTARFNADCIESVALMCNNNGSGGFGTAHAAGPICCSQGTHLYTVFTTTCSGGGSELGEVVTSPHGGGGSENLTPPNPCNNLKKHLSTTTGIKLKSPQVYPYLTGQLNQPNEYGFYFKKENNVYTPYQSYNATTNKLTVQVGGNYFCSIHTHPYPGTNAMFSWEDMYSLQQYFQNVNPELMEEVTIFLVVKDSYGVDQLYALKVDDFTTFSDFLLDDIDNTVKPDHLAGLTTDEERSKEILKRMNAKQHKYNKENPNMNQEVPFLTYFAGCGASLYKANSALNNWDKLTLSNNSTNPITKTPCN